MCGSYTAGAQEYMYGEEWKPFTAALLPAVNFTQIDGDDYYGYHKVGLNAGAQVYVHFNERFGVSMELSYTQKGSRGQTIVESPYIGTYVAKYFMNLNYVEVPVLLHYIYRNLDWEGGVSYAYLVRSKEWILSDIPATITDEANHFNATDADWLLGVSRKLYKRWYGNFRFQYSIFSIRPTERIPIGYRYGNNGQFNNMITLRLCYQL